MSVFENFYLSGNLKNYYSMKTWAENPQLTKVNLRRGKIIHETTQLEGRMDTLILEYFIKKELRIEFMHSFLAKESIGFSFKHEICGFIGNDLDKGYFDKIKKGFNSWMNDIKDLRNDAAHRIFWEWMEMEDHAVYLTKKTTDGNKIKLKEISFTANKMKRHRVNCAKAGLVIEVLITKNRAKDIKKLKASES